MPERLLRTLPGNGFQLVEPQARASAAGASVWALMFTCLFVRGQFGVILFIFVYLCICVDAIRAKVPTDTLEMSVGTFDEMPTDNMLA